MRKIHLFVFLFAWLCLAAQNKLEVSETPSSTSFCVAADGKAALIQVDSADWKGVKRAADDLRQDILQVTGINTALEIGAKPKTGTIIIGTIGKSELITHLVETKRIDVSEIQGQWEAYLVQIVDGSLVIAGSDKRGTIYGIYELSERIGVSPWYWWADVPAQKHQSVHVKTQRLVQPSPKVKYRGLFINDEWPSFGLWTQTRFGGQNSKAYVHLFELLLRLKANYLWPAMWNSRFNEDDPMNPFLADEYGIVMGTSHHEPMMRAHKEYTTRREEVGPWDYASNQERIDRFFREGMKRNSRYENLVTIGMRGDGDVAMGKGDDEDNIRTLEKVIRGQRKILEDTYQRRADEIPQLWAIFTEVQRYYDAGFTVPDDVTLLFCDNNWGYIRRTGPDKEKNRKGGLGLYYHIDMNGGPWNDRWINTTTIPKLREQLSLAYRSGIDRIWIINVGDLKPKEYPIDFIMHYAWNPDSIQAGDEEKYTRLWAAQNFGDSIANEVADIITTYSRLNLLRKPEVQTTTHLSLVNHHEADQILQQWRDVSQRAKELYQRISPEARDAFFQLVLYPAVASAGVAEIYIAAAYNQLYARQGRVIANRWAARAKQLFEEDILLSNYYNDSLANGKWKGMMHDVHIGYKEWFMPQSNELPPLTTVQPLPVPTMGVAVEGSTESGEQLQLPVFENMNPKEYYIDVFNRGTGQFQFKATPDQAWILLSQKSGSVDEEQRITVSINWDKLKVGTHQGAIRLTDGKETATITVSATKAELPNTDDYYFGSLTTETAIAASQYNANIKGKTNQWRLLPGLGRFEGCMGASNNIAPNAETKDAARLEYNVWLNGNTNVCLGILPTQDVNPQRGLRIGVSLDDGEVHLLDARQGFVDTFAEYTSENIARSQVLKPLPPINSDIYLRGTNQLLRNEVFDNMRWLDVDLGVATKGLHRLKIWQIDPEVVLDRIILNPDNRYPSYLGSPCHKQQ